MTSKNTVHKMVAYVILAAVCVITIAVTLPIINRYIDDPNLISYFNHDESFFMGMIWYYYSGEKGPYYRFNADYGIEMLYIADFARLFLSKFIVFTPVTFIIIMRWLRLIFWILSFLALWHLARRHFGGIGQALVAVILLALNPGFALVMQSSKPDTSTLFFTIVGLDYTLRLFEDRRKLNIAIAVACAALATIIKFSGIFLLPAIIIAIYLSVRADVPRRYILPEIRIAYLLPALIGLLFITLSFIAIFFYIRQSSGMTWYREFGLLGSIAHNRSVIFMIICGTIFIAASFLLGYTKKRHLRILNMEIDRLNETLSYSFVVVVLFICWSALFGFRWFVNPQHFINTYSFMIPIFLDGIARASSVGQSVLALVENFIVKAKEFGLPIFGLFIFYLFVEFRNRKTSIVIDRINFFKRITAASFALLLFPCMFFMLHLRSIHMMPFFAVCTLLAMQVAAICIRSGKEKPIIKKIVVGIIFVCFIASALYNSHSSFNIFKKIYGWRKDNVFEIAEWWRNRYPKSISIVADNPLFVYMPPQYDNVTFLSSQKERSPQLNYMVKKIRPRLIYYNTAMMPPVEKMLPGVILRMVAAFDRPTPVNSNDKNVKHVIYEAMY